MPSLKIKLLHVVCSAFCEISTESRQLKGYTFMSFFSTEKRGVCS
ncbi:hypothetical protein BAXH7_03709 [Bacillus amyloliquefaciens XH7]|nr:hypothetical protein BAXH7_03709 [Bacillus amyloliquefaciens XH7]